MIDKEMSRGLIKILVLNEINTSDAYGYIIIKGIYEKSEGLFDLKDGTIYPILHALERDKNIKSYWLEGENQRKRKYYSITSIGKETLKDYIKQWSLLKNSINNILGEKHERF